MTDPRPGPRIVAGVEGIRRLCLLLGVLYAPVVFAGCSKSCEGSSEGTLRVTNRAPVGGPLVVSVGVFDDEVLPVAGSDEVLFPGEGVSFRLAADAYRVVVSWDGGVTSEHGVEVEDTPDDYELDLDFLGGSDDDEDDLLAGGLDECPLRVTGLDVSPP